MLGWFLKYYMLSTTQHDVELNEEFEEALKAGGTPHSLYLQYFSI
jgi:hypothetical protein